MKKISLILTGVLTLSLVACQSPTETNEDILISETIENVDESLVDVVHEINDSVNTINEEVENAKKVNYLAAVRNITMAYISENQTVPVEGNPTINEFLESYSPDKVYKVILEELPADKMKDEYFNYTCIIDNEFNVHLVENI